MVIESDFKNDKEKVSNEDIFTQPQRTSQKKKPMFASEDEVAADMSEEESYDYDR